MKKVLIGLTLLFLIGIAACVQPPADVAPATLEEDVVEQVEEQFEEASVETKQINKELSTFEFEGFAIGKSHAGTFDDMSGTLTFEDGKIVAAQGTIDAASVNTGIAGLDNHLKNEDFFDVEKFPEISYSSKSIGNDVMVGSLTFHGVTKQLSFPVVVKENSIEAEFLLDMSLFGIEYTGVNKDVQITFKATAE